MTLKTEWEEGDGNTTEASHLPGGVRKPFGRGGMLVLFLNVECSPRRRTLMQPLCANAVS